VKRKSLLELSPQADASKLPANRYTGIQGASSHASSSRNGEGFATPADRSSRRRRHSSQVKPMTEGALGESRAAKMLRALDSDSESDGIQQVPPSRESRVSTASEREKPSREFIKSLKKNVDPFTKSTDDDLEEDSIIIIEPNSPEKKSDDFPVDDEFSEYVKRAKQRQEQALAAREVPTSDDPQTSPRYVVNDQAIIYITSQIPETRAMLFKCRLFQPLALTQTAWCAAQRRDGLLRDIESDDDIIFTWRGNKIYNSTTLVSLGIHPNAFGGLTVSGAGNSSSEGFKKDWSRVHMEAWTIELYEEYLKEKERKEKRGWDELGSESNNEEAETEQDEYQSGQNSRGQVQKIFLKAKDTDRVEVPVWKSTSILTLATVFRKKSGIPMSKEVVIMFDGEKLEPQMTIADTEIAEGDALDVYIK
jgi:hypothetical protein